MTMRYLIICLVLLLGGALETVAQPGFQGKRERMEQYKIAYITKEVNLTTEEAQQFWPIYNDYTEKLRVIQRKRLGNMVQWGSAESLEEKEAIALMDEQIQSKEDELALFKEYHKKYLEVLPVNKVMILYRAENQFKRDVLRKVGEKAGERNR